MILNRMIFTGIFIFFSNCIFAQKILVIENINSLKNFKYYQGDQIFVKIDGFQGRISDQIADMTDSTIIFYIMGEFTFDKVKCIYRENWLIKTLRGLSLIGGTAYLGIDSFNRLINHEYPVIESETLMISGGMVAFSFALIPFNYRKINTRGNWQMRTIDLNSF